jgi:hypothetical protein
MRVGLKSKRIGNWHLEAIELKTLPMGTKATLIPSEEIPRERAKCVRKAMPTRKRKDEQSRQ